MRAPLGLIPALVLALVIAPTATAQTCLSQLDDLCARLDEHNVDLLFGDYGDVAVLVLAFALVLLLVTEVFWLFRHASSMPDLKAEPRERRVHVAPGGTVQLLVDVENLREDASLNVDVDWQQLPPGWTAESFGTVVYASGFSAPKVVYRVDPLHLTSRRRGGHTATLAVQLTAPEGTGDETVDVPVRVVPIIDGVPQPRWSEELTFSVTLTERYPGVQIVNVEHEPAEITSGQAVHTRTRLVNTGESDARGVSVNFLLNEQAVDRRIIEALGPNQETTVEFDWVPGSGENRIRISLV